MNILGFASKSNGQLTASSFLRENIIGFGEKRGLKSSNFIFASIPSDVKSDLIIGTYLSDDKRVLLLPIRKESEPKMVLALNNRFESKLTTIPPSFGFYTLWDTLASCMRFWNSYTEQIPTAELVPASALRRIARTQELCKILDKRFYDENWSPEIMRRKYDAAFVGFCVAGLVNDNPDVRNSINEDQLAEIIFTVRKNNWEQFVEWAN